MKICTLTVIVSLSLLITLTSTQAEQPKTGDPKAAGPKTAQFGQVFSDWKDLMGKLAALKTKYRAADETQRGEIQRQWKELIEKASGMEGQLVAAAEEAYKEAPNADPQVSELLVGSVGDRCERDDYERAYATAKVLLDGKCPDPNLSCMAGIAAFCVNDFETAETCLQQAKSANKLTKIGEMNLESIPYYKDAWAKEKKIREAEAKADDLPRVLLKTTQGDVEIELFENEAPTAVGNFITLVDKGFYNGLTFHRVLANFMAQGGDPTGDGTGGPEYHIPCECYTPNHRLHFRGSLSMAHAGRDTGGSQFFLTFVPTTHLDGHHTVFGRVTKGFDVLTKLKRRDPQSPDAPKPDKIIEAKVLRKRPASKYADFKKAD